MKVSFEDIAPINGKILVKLVKPSYKKVPQRVVDPMSEKDTKKGEKVAKFKEEITKVLMATQVAEVLAVDKGNKDGIVPGDLVIIDVRGAQEFDMHKGTYRLELFQVFAKVNLM